MAAQPEYDWELALVALAGPQGEAVRLAEELL